MVLYIVFVGVCIVQFCYIINIRKQLNEWHVFLKNVHDTPKRKSFVKGNNILAKINFELNGILEENREQFVKLQRAENANKQLLTDLSHDVRTPLSSLVGYLESLDAQTVKNKEEYIHVAYRKALDLQELIDLLFQWFKLASNEQLFQMKNYDINELTRELIIEYIPVFEKKKIAISVNISDNEWFVKIDRMAYRRIINNLISNAVKHGNCSFIEIEIQKTEEQVLISVSNNGTAIPLNELPFVFNRLYKFDTARTKNGNGLGLSIVSELTKAMSGEITVQSIPGGMTTFYLTLPLM